MVAARTMILSIMHKFLRFSEQKSIIELKIVGNDKDKKRRERKQKTVRLYTCTNCTWTTTSGLYCCGQTDGQKCITRLEKSANKMKKKKTSNANDLIFHWYFERISLGLFIILVIQLFSFCFEFRSQKRRHATKTKKSKPQVAKNDE